MLRKSNAILIFQIVNVYTSRIAGARIKIPVHLSKSEETATFASETAIGRWLLYIYPIIKCGNEKKLM